MYEPFQFYCYYFIRVFISITFFDLNGRREREMHPVYGEHNGFGVFEKEKKNKNLTRAAA